MPAIAKIYENSNYSCRTLQLQGVGDYDYSTLASYSFNDLTSSNKIECGFYLKAFADAGFKGASALLTGSTSYVGSGFNTKISSLRLASGSPNSPSTVDNSNYGAAYRQPLNQNLLQSAWNNGAFMLEVAWKDPKTGVEVKKEILAPGRGSHMLGGPKDSAFAVETSAHDTWMANIAFVLEPALATSGISAFSGTATTNAAKWVKAHLEAVDVFTGGMGPTSPAIPGNRWTLKVDGCLLRFGVGSSLMSAEVSLIPNLV